MTKEAQQIYQAIIGHISDETVKLSGAEYYDLLEEVASHVEGLRECYREEHFEDFE